MSQHEYDDYIDKQYDEAVDKRLEEEREQILINLILESFVLILRSFLMN